MATEITNEFLQDIKVKAETMIEIHKDPNQQWWADINDWTVRHLEDDCIVCQCDSIELALHVAAANPNAVLAMVSEISKLRAQITIIEKTIARPI